MPPLGTRSDPLRFVLFDPDGCWEWLGPVNRQGYGQFNSQPAHRAVWRWFGLEVALGIDLHHDRCRNRRCVRPDHLAPLEHAEHSRLHALERLMAVGAFFPAAREGQTLP